MSSRSTPRACVAATAIAAALLAWLPAGPALAGSTPPVADADAYPAVEDTQLVVNAPGVLDGDTDAENDPLTAELVSTTSNGALLLGTDGSFIYTPAADWGGEDSFTYRPLDDPDPDPDPGNTVTVTITVEAVNDAPVADDEAYSTDEDTALVEDATEGVLAGDTDVDGDTLSAAVDDDVDHGTLALAADGSFTYTPAAEYGGADAFTYTASDGSGGTDTGAVAITVNPIDDPVTAEDDAPPSTPRNTPISVAVLTNDSDPDGDATVAVTADPTNGVAVPNADRTITYTPNADWSGQDSFVYTLTNPGTQGGSDTATVTVIVNDPPIAGDDSTATPVDTSVVIPVLANDTDVEDGGALTVQEPIPDTPNGGTVLINADGTVTYTPGQGYRCADSFDYTVMDSGLAADTATVTVSVQDTPTVTESRSALIINYAATVTITGTLVQHADSLNDMLEIWRTPEGSYPRLMASGPVNASGKFVATSPRIYKDNWFQVKFAGDECFEPGQSQLKTVRVRAKATSTMYACTNPARPPGGCYYGTSGIYKLFRITATNDPLYEVKVIPSHPGGLVTIEMQRLVAGVWQAYASFPGLTLDGNSVFGTGLPANTVGSWRARGIFQGHDDHASKAAPWAFFKITK